MKTSPFPSFASINLPYLDSPKVYPKIDIKHLESRVYNISYVIKLFTPSLLSIQKAIFFGLFLLTLTTRVFAESPDFNKLADAIYKAEGSRKASRPYGIFFPGCSWSSPAYCRRICLNTLNSAYKRFLSSNSSLPYLDYLAQSYAPLGALNDPLNLNRHWLSNVRYFYKEAL